MGSKFSYEDIYDFSKVAMFDLKEKIKDGKYVSVEDCWNRLCLDALGSCIQAYCSRIMYRDKRKYFTFEMPYPTRIEAMRDFIVLTLDPGTIDLIKKILDNKDKDQYEEINKVAREINEKLFEFNKELYSIITGAMYSDKYLAFMQWSNQYFPGSTRKLLYKMYKTSNIVIDDSDIVDLESAMYWQML